MTRARRGAALLLSLIEHLELLRPELERLLFQMPETGPIPHQLEVALRELDATIGLLRGVQSERKDTEKTPGLPTRSRNR